MSKILAASKPWSSEGSDCDKQNCVTKEGFSSRTGKFRHYNPSGLDTMYIMQQHRCNRLSVKGPSVLRYLAFHSSVQRAEFGITVETCVTKQYAACKNEAQRPYSNDPPATGLRQLADRHHSNARRGKWLVRASSVGSQFMRRLALAVTL
jgi:hypothetical protein